MRDKLTRAWKLVGYVPVSVLLVFGVSWGLVAAGVGRAEVDVTLVTLLNPLWYVLSMVVHADAAHFWGNMYILVPFGVLLTLLTNNRHVMLVMVVSHVLGSVVRVAVAPAAGIGTSGAALALVAAALVRTAGYALQNVSTGWLTVGLTGLFVPAVFGFLVIAVLAGGGPVAHFIHFFAFLFGGAIEAMYVFSAHEPGDESGRDGWFGRLSA